MTHPALNFSGKKRLVRVAAGREPADRIFKNLRVVNVLSGELLDREVAVAEGRVAALGEKGSFVEGKGTEVVNGGGNYLIPGLLDAHVHVESSMLSPSRLAEVSLDRGITGIFFDPHEVANVLGVEGISWMVQDLKETPLNGFLTVPSSVPATSPEYETAGAELGPEETEEVLSWPSAVALGEVMNYPGVLNLEVDVWKKMAAAEDLGKVLEGHAAGLGGEDLSAYRAAGIESDHEAVEAQEGAERIRNGFWTYIREGSAWSDLEEVIKAVTEKGLDSGRVCLVTDDRGPEDWTKEGGLDYAVNRAIREGLEPLEAIKMATLNPAARFGMEKHLGSIAPGRRADFFLSESLDPIRAERTFVSAVEVEEESWGSSFPEGITGTVNIDGGSVSPEDFRLREREKRSGMRLAGGIGTELIEFSDAGKEKETVKLAAVERHKSTGNIARTRLEGFGLDGGAVASSVAHDSHNILVAGKENEAMTEAVNRIAEVGGGQVLVEEGEVISEVRLPLAGLMSDVSPSVLGENLKELREALKERGCGLDHPLMTLSSLALPVIPEARLTDKGLMDVDNFELVV